MNIFLVGNGFDLHFGLPTKYINFLHVMSYIEKQHIYLSDKPLINLFEDGELIKTDVDLNNFYKKFGTVLDKIFFKAEDYQYINNSMNNCWLKYFLHSLDEDKGWIDFEKEIRFVVESFNKFCNKNGTGYQESFIAKKFGFLYISHDTFDKKYVCEYPKGSNITKLDKEKISNHLYEELVKFSKLLQIYLYYFVDEVVYKSNNQQLITNDSAFKRADKVVTFNYTNTFELFCRKEDVLHIHGKLDNDIVLGINPDAKDELTDLDTAFIKFKKYYQRIIYKTDNEYLKFIDDIKQIHNYNINGLPSQPINIVVVGHSLDSTDEDIIKELFEVASNILIACHNDGAIGQYIKNLISIYGKNEFDSLRSRTNLEFVSYEKLNHKLLSD